MTWRDGAAGSEQKRFNRKERKVRQVRNLKLDDSTKQRFHSFRPLHLCAFAGEIFFWPYLNGAQGAGVMMVFSCITMNSRVAGGHPFTVLLASARSRSRSSAFL